jgi:twinkle protein
MAEAAQDATALHFVLHYVSHLATPEGKPHEENGRVMVRHFKGSRAIGYWSHFLFGIGRDTQAPDTPTTLRCLKDRFTGNANGLTWGLHYDRATGRVSECDLSDFEDEAGETDTDF